MMKRSPTKAAGRPSKVKRAGSAVKTAARRIFGKARGKRVRSPLTRAMFDRIGAEEGFSKAVLDRAWADKPASADREAILNGAAATETAVRGMLRNYLGSRTDPADYNGKVGGAALAHCGGQHADACWKDGVPAAPSSGSSGGQHSCGSIGCG